MRFELADCNSSGCTSDPVDLVAFLNFRLKNMNAFLKLCQRKGSSSFISLLALSSPNLHLIFPPNPRFGGLSAF